MDNLKYWVWLTVKESMNPYKITALLDKFGSIEEIYDADTYIDIDGIEFREKRELLNKSLDDAEEVIEKTKILGARIVTQDSEEYPQMLREIQPPPYVLYMKGKNFDWDNFLSIGVIGARDCSDYGIIATRKLCNELAAAGVTIVSGMARGIDSVASISALKNGGKTIAVIGSGLDVCYPPENDELMEAIFENGLVITEYPPGSQPIGYHFPERNRIISGLSRGILVTEAAKHSGTFTTVRRAIEAGKDIFAIPGGIFHKESEGTNMLIKRGAILTTSVRDIFEQYPEDAARLERASGKAVEVELPEQKPKKPRKPKQKEKPPEKEKITLAIDDDRFKGLNERELAVIGLLLEGELHVDEIVRQSGMGIQELNAVLPMLEMMGQIKKSAGNVYRIE